MEHTEYKERLSERLSLFHLTGVSATTTDALLLAALLPAVGGTAVELGAGVGTVALLAYSHGRFPAALLCERQPPLAALARRNVRENGWENALSILEGDLRHLPCERTHPLVFANPPYRRAHEGRPAQSPLADAARFERAGGFRDFCLAAEGLLSHDGVFCFVFPTARREEAEATLAACHLFPRRIVTVSPYPGGKSKIFLAVAGRTPAAVRGERIVLATCRGGEPSEAACRLNAALELITEGEPE